MAGTLCCFGTYDPETPRFQTLKAAWPGRVVELHAPLWPGAGERAAIAPSGGLLRWGARWLGAQRRLWAQRQALAEADAVLVPYPGHFDMPLAWWLARRYGKRLIFDPFLSLHETAVGDRRLFAASSVRGVLTRIIDRLSLRLADVVLADTPADGAFFTELGARRVAVVRIAADESLFVPQAREPRWDVLFVGRMSPLHGIGTILEAARRLEPEGVRFMLVGTGQAPLDDAPGNVERLEGVSYGELPALIASAPISLGLFSAGAKASRVVPHKVVEAAAMGRAIVSADTPAMREAFGSAVVLVPPEDPAALADVIRGLLAEPERRAALGEAARSRFEAGFSVGALRSALEAALRV